VILTARCPELRFAVHEDGEYEVLSAWHPVVAFERALLERARQGDRRLALRGDELEIFCTNGGATYALEPELSGYQIGRLATSWRK